MATNKETAVQAIAALQSLPQWEGRSWIYGHLSVHLQDLLKDLEDCEWEDLTNTLQGGP
jgi:hypothetical protein